MPRSVEWDGRTLAATADVRALPHQMRELLKKAPIPDAEEAEGLFRALQRTAEYVTAALSAFESGDDAGEPAQLIYDLQMKGASNSDIREALQAAANAA